MLPQLVNLPRARALMERAGTDALVARLPINVYYLTGDWRFLASEGGIWMPGLHAYSSPLDDDAAAEAERPHGGRPSPTGQPSEEHCRRFEDTVFITADGQELLTTAGLDLRCVPG